MLLNQALPNNTWKGFKDIAEKESTVRQVQFTFNEG